MKTIEALVEWSIAELERSYFRRQKELEDVQEQCVGPSPARIATSSTALPPPRCAFVQRVVAPPSPESDKRCAARSPLQARGSIISQGPDVGTRPSSPRCPKGAEEISNQGGTPSRRAQPIEGDGSVQRGCPSRRTAVQHQLVGILARARAETAATRVQQGRLESQSTPTPVQQGRSPTRRGFEIRESHDKQGRRRGAVREPRYVTKLVLDVFESPCRNAKSGPNWHSVWPRRILPSCGGSVPAKNMTEIDSLVICL
jgi:hypothetical protein